MRWLRPRAMIALTILLVAGGVLQGAPVPAVTEHAAGSTRFSAIGELPGKPAPTVLVIAMDRRTSLEKSSFNRSALLLRERHGFLCVSLDVPVHGDDARTGEKTGIAGWRSRIEQGEDIVSEFVQRAGDVIRYLIANGHADPKRIVVIGTSRGGYLGLHLAAANRDVAAVAALAPPIDLLDVTEFEGLENHRLTRSLSLLNVAGEPGLRKPLWITIGNADERVNTDRCIAFARAVAAAAPAEVAMRPIELHVVPGEGHRQPPHTHENAAAWIARTFGL